MNSIFTRLLVILTVLACSCLVFAGQPPTAGSTPDGAAAAQPQLTPVVISVLAPPVPVKMTDQKWWTYYEFFLTNTTGWPLTLERLVVSDADDPSRIRADMPREEISRYLRMPGGNVAGATLGGSQSCIIWMNVPFFHPGAVPEALEHTFTMTVAMPGGEKQVTTARYTVDIQLVVEDQTPTWLYTPPVHGRRWLVAASGGLTYHRTALMGIDCEWHLAQRHAFDLIQLTSDYRLVSGPVNLNESYPVYGQEVVSVRHGVVVAVHDGEPDNTPGHKPPDMTAAKAAGNHVVVDVGRGRYALYAHLIPGSIRVVPGEAVLRGQVLGLAGNSGNSDAPHLHFHMMDGPDPLKSNGLPCIFQRFTFNAIAVFPDNPDAMEEINNGGPIPIQGTALKRNREYEMPQDMSIVDFR